MSQGRATRINWIDEYVDAAGVHRTGKAYWGLDPGSVVQAHPLFARSA